MSDGEGIVQKVDEVFTEEALRDNDGKTVPLTAYPGGPVVGKATMRYDPGQKALVADLNVTDPKVAEALKWDPAFHISKE